MDAKVKLKVQGLTNSQVKSGAYALILSENGARRIPIIMGISEAQSIAIALENIRPPRPLTHDLFTSFSRAFKIRLREVLICRFEEGIYYSEMVFSDGVNEVRIDSRTSDAVAIALRMKCNIYTYESIMKKCGIVLEEDDITKASDALFSGNQNPDEVDDKAKLHEWLRLLQKSEIEERMEKVIAEENYELAKIFKEELLRREKEEDDL
ncbi:MAG: bifunctional nuclease family protein [Tannerella sp.]|jgi:bifunctional DNase/RNase|nr:bifunctional nuclease family protein [Tannerella sp.]